MKNSFLIYHEYRYILADLTNEEIGILFRSLLDYEIDKIEPNFTGILKMAFRLIKCNLDRDSDKYDKRCETSVQNGKLGGRPRKSNEKPNENLKKPKKADNETDNEKENDNDTDADSVNRTSADLSVADESETNADLFTFNDEEETSADLFNFIEEAFGRTLNSIEYELIQTWEDNELTRYAVKESILNGARSLRYVQAVIESWKANGFKTVQDVQAYQEKYKKNKSKEQRVTVTELPEWFDKDQKNEEMPEEEQRELKEFLEGVNTK